jgi:hypothetical protein
MKLFNMLNRFDKLMTAIAFAEANDPDTAMRIAEAPQCAKKQRTLRKSNEKQQDSRPRRRM